MKDKSDLKQRNPTSGVSELGNLMGSEFLAGRDVANLNSLSLAFLERISDIQKQQFAWQIEDQTLSLQQLANLEPPLSVWMRFCSRQTQHWMDAARQFNEAANALTDHYQTVQKSLWSQQFPGITAPFEMAQLQGTRVQSHTDLLARLHKDHSRLAHVLISMEKFLAENKSLQNQDLDVFASLVDYVSEYPDVVHHPLENRVYEQLLKTQLNKAQIASLDSIVSQHTELSAATQQLLRLIDELYKGSNVSYDSFHSAANAYIKMQRDHMVREEKDFFPLAEQTLNLEDWESIEQSVSHPDDPLFEQRLSRYENLYSYGVEGL